MDDEIEGMVVFCNRGHVMFSNVGEIISKPKQKSNTVYINPVFNMMISYCQEDDDDIKKFLIKASKNIFSKDIKFNNNKLILKSKKKEINLSENSNIRDEFLKFKEFYHENIKYKKNNLFEIKEKYVEINSWKESTKLQDYLIILYIEKLKNSLNLTQKESDELESLIKISLICNYINNTNIIVKKNVIIDIENIKFDGKKRKFYIVNKNFKSIKLQKKSDSNSYNDSIITEKNEQISIEKKIDKLLNFVTKNCKNF